jgi:hypothetical protein
VKLTNAKINSKIFKLGGGIALIGILSPMFIGIDSTGHGLFISAVMFTCRCGTSFYFHEPLIAIQYLPFVMLRPVLAYEFARYHEGKSTMERVTLAGILGEIPILLMNAFTLPVVSEIMVPSPLHILVSVFILMYSPPYRVSTPWQEST